MNKFKVGEKVACYAGSRFEATIKEVKGQYLTVTNPSIGANGAFKTLAVHYKQCRKFIKNERRKLYVAIPSYSIRSVVGLFDKDEADEWIKNYPMYTLVEFVEARKK